MTNKYQLDPSHSTASFSIKHMMIAKVHGGFEKISGTLVIDSESPVNTYVEASIEAGSIITHEAQRDTHLKSADFFDAEKFPKITFRSTQIENVGGGNLKVIGDLTIRDVMKQVTLDVEGPSAEIKDPWGQIRIGASGTTKIKRKEFGLNWNAALEAGGFLVGDDVNITLEVQFVKQAL